MIKFENVSFSYGDKKIIDNLSLTFNDGKFYCVVGESGIGKTTLLKLCYGVLKPVSGKIINSFKKASYVFDKDNLFNDTVLNNLICISNDLKKIDELLEYFKLEEFKNSNINKLSNGQKRRVAIIRCLLVDADIYYLDEAIRGLDEDNVKQVIEKFKEIFRNKTVIYITHNPDEVIDLADEIVKL